MKKLEGWKKMALGALLILAGAACLAVGEEETGMKLIALGVGVFTVGNIADKILNGKK